MEGLNKSQTQENVIAQPQITESALRKLRQAKRGRTGRQVSKQAELDVKRRRARLLVLLPGRKAMAVAGMRKKQHGRK